MLKRTLPLCILLLAPAVARSDDVKQPAQTPPTIVVRLASLDTLFDRLQLVGGLLGKDDLGKKLDQSIKNKLGATGLYGIDGKRPIGLYARVGADISDISGVLMVPLTGPKEFKEELGRHGAEFDFRGMEVCGAKEFKQMLEGLGWEVSGDNTGLYTVKQNIVPIDVQYRVANGYAYVGLLGQNMLAPDRLLTPEQVFGAKPSAAALSLTLQLSQIPEDLRGLFGDTLKEALGKSADKAGKSTTQQAMRAAFTREITRILDNVLKDGEELNAQLDIEQHTKQMVIELTLTAKAGSKLAEDIAKLGQPLQFDVDMTRIAPAMEKNQAAAKRAQALPEAGDDARMQVSLEGGPVLRVRFTMGLSAFKVLPQEKRE